MKIYILFFIILHIILYGCANDGAGTEPPQDIGLDNSIFPDTNLIELNSPTAGEVVTNDQPHFSWKSSGNTMVFLGLFTKSISIKGKNISNVNDIVWAWHSGLGKGRAGDVEFLEGVDVLNGELITDRPPSPLFNGQMYYWAVWAWNEEGIEITHSSNEFYFLVSF